MKHKKLLSASILLLLALLASCGSAPKEREEKAPEEPTPVAEPVKEEVIVDRSTEIDGNWMIVGYQDSGSKETTKLEKSIPVTLKEGDALIKLAGRNFKGTYVVNTNPKGTLKFSLLTPSSTKESDDSRVKFLEAFLSESVQKSTRYRLNGNKLSLISSGATLYLEK